ncbi:hypothetical protein F8388_003198, partial [Cannabis sativa]
KKKRSDFSKAEMSSSYVGSLDQGTTSTRFIIYDKQARPVGSHQVEFKQYYPEAGVRNCIAKAVEKAKEDGHDVENGLKAIGKLEKELSGGRTFVETCGLPISTYFSAVKLLWLLENVETVKKAVENGDALFGTIDSWLIWNLTGGVNGGVHVTDVSNASRTMLMNLKTLEWDKPTLETWESNLGFCQRLLVTLRLLGTSQMDGYPGVPISGCLGDQHAAMLGQACRKGEAKSTYGTGAFILLNTGEEIIHSKNGLLSTLAYKLGPNSTANYALEGSIAIAGAAVQWLRDSLGVISSASEIEALAKSVETTGGVYFVPAFNGLFAPWWRDDARGVCIGITRFTTKAHIARAVLESMCFQVRDVLESMHKDAGEKGETKNEKGEFLLRVDGGAAVNDLLMQIQVWLIHLFHSFFTIFIEYFWTHSNFPE